ADWTLELSHSAIEPSRLIICFTFVADKIIPLYSVVHDTIRSSVFSGTEYRTQQEPFPKAFADNSSGSGYWIK
ncbi:MAG: hypothetical protein WC124_09940, partial [Desulfoplanes sp.]